MAMHTMLINKPPDSGKGLLFVQGKEKCFVKIHKVDVLSIAMCISAKLYINEYVSC